MVEKTHPQHGAPDGAVAAADVVSARIAAAAARALAEAAERRKAPVSALPPEKGGRPGPEPTRYGDWEKKGMICDF